MEAARRQPSGLRDFHQCQVATRPIHDAIVDLDFEVDSVNCVDIGRVPLRRVSATGVAVKFDKAA